MDETDFWEIIDRAREDAEGDPEDQADLVVERLTGLDPDSVLDFARHFEARLNRALRWELWGAAALLTGDPGDDAFDAFRCWLVGQGRHAYEGAVHHADDLATLLDGFDERADGDGEDLGYAADEAYERLTGLPLPDLGVPDAEDPDGEEFDVSDSATLRDRYPALWERFGW
ncbi:DUF4240 domain-containing protein [Streptomyces sp. SL13]|uniref:DUF4240 domain-containing protein n=1 Tax=Streptantibioticus silvisoli TaxID=2705255 RepID=A0AA90KEQ2_9ACTN|nr:DUF4240 domain-containing protein [Streptantibioticus silvisoli]MDI5967461.1 DUF4240 domain-containing protein [Streptantibioticus silvisoli]MDI5968265.1 DUF4240 domain-containing protein [Streptantibioticus silvisoli]